MFCSSYIVISPKTIRPGLTVRISATILQASSDVRVQTDVIANANRTRSQATASKTISPGISKPAACVYFRPYVRGFFIRIGASGFIELQVRLNV